MRVERRHCDRRCVQWACAALSATVAAALSLDEQSSRQALDLLSGSYAVCRNGVAQAFGTYASAVPIQHRRSVRAGG